MNDREEQRNRPSAKRRRVVVGLSALVFPVALLAQTDLVGWARVAFRVRSLYGKVDKLLEWTEWGQDAAAAIGTGKPPPHPPYSGSNYLLKQVDDARKDISDISVPTFDSPLPIAGMIDFRDFPMARDALRSRVQLLGSACAEVIHVKPVLSMLDAYQAKLGAISKALEILSEELVRLAGAGVDFTEKLSWSSFAIQSDYIPAVNGLDSDVGRKKLAIREALQTRSREIRQSADWLHAQLALEAQNLSAEALRLKKLRDDLESRKTALDNREYQLRQMQEASNDLLKKYNILAADLSNNRTRLRNAESTSRSLSEQYVDWSETRPKAWRCPQNATLWTCSAHKDLVNQFYVQQQNALKAINANVNNNQNEQKHYRNEISRIEREQRDLRGQMDQQDAEIRIEENSLKMARDQWNRDTQIMWQEHYKSKADLFVQENANDASALNRLDSQLNL